MVAQTICEADVLGTVVVVVAVLQATGDTASALTVLSGGTGIAIVALFSVVGMGTTSPRLAHIVRTWIPIVTTLQTIERAESAGTMIAQRTLITIVASNSIRGMGTTLVGLATIVRTGIPVVAVFRLTGCADPFGTYVIGGAEVPVAAASHVVSMHTSLACHTGIVRA